MDAVRGERIAGQGNSESVWQGASALKSLPESSLAHLLGGACRLVIVAPHPDDEILGCGGLIATAVAAGYDVLLIALTDGEAAYPEDRHWHPRALAPVRRAELVAAGRELGVQAGQVIHLGFPDGQLRTHCHEAANAVAAYLQSTDAVFVTWRNDGHPDHEAAADAVALAAEDTGAMRIEYPIWAWHWADPIDAPFLGSRSVRLPLSAESAAAKRRALDCFRTQTGQCEPAPAQPVLPAHVLARFKRDFEVYCR